MTNRQLGLAAILAGLILLGVALFSPGVPLSDRGAICITAAVSIGVGYILRGIS